MICIMYAGAPSCCSELMIQYHLAVLKAFFTSRVTTAQYFFEPRFQRLPAMALRADCTTLTIASTVDLVLFIGKATIPFSEAVQSVTDDSF